MNVKIDLHTHSIISHDGSLHEKDYAALLEKGTLDCIAITDHNETSFAQMLHQKFGNKIIVGEEITTTDGEMIGLFLAKTIPPGFTAKKTADAIHEQGGIVLIPHPFETLRKGIQRSVLEQIVDMIGLIEVFNGRGRWRGKAQVADAFAKQYHLPEVANSDAHGILGIGKTYSMFSEIPTRTNLISLARKGQLQKVYAPTIAYLYPAINVIKNKSLPFRKKSEIISSVVKRI